MNKIYKEGDIIADYSKYSPMRRIDASNLKVGDLVVCVDNAASCGLGRAVTVRAIGELRDESNNLPLICWKYGTHQDENNYNRFALLTNQSGKASIPKKFKDLFMVKVIREIELSKEGEEFMKFCKDYGIS